MQPLVGIFFLASLVVTIINAAPVEDAKHAPISNDEVLDVRAIADEAEALPKASAITAFSPKQIKIDDNVEKLEGAESAYVPFYGGYPYYPYYKPYYGYPGYPGYPLVYVG